MEWFCMATSLNKVASMWWAVSVATWRKQNKLLTFWIVLIYTTSPQHRRDKVYKHILVKWSRTLLEHFMKRIQQSICNWNATKTLSIFIISDLKTSNYINSVYGIISNNLTQYSQTWNNMFNWGVLCVCVCVCVCE